MSPHPAGSEMEAGAAGSAQALSGEVGSWHGGGSVWPVFCVGGLEQCPASLLRGKCPSDESIDFGFLYKYTKKQAQAASALKGAGDPRSFSSDDLVHVRLKRDL